MLCRTTSITERYNRLTQTNSGANQVEEMNRETHKEMVLECIKEMEMR